MGICVYCPFCGRALCVTVHAHVAEGSTLADACAAAVLWGRLGLAMIRIAPMWLILSAVRDRPYVSAYVCNFARLQVTASQTAASQCLGSWWDQLRLFSMEHHRCYLSYPVLLLLWQQAVTSSQCH
jgi:hypothetical protein